MKKIILVVLGIIISIFTTLFIIQTIDERINGDDYKKIHIFGKHINTTIKDGTACTKDLDIFFNVLFNDKYKTEESTFDNKSIEDKINACYSLSEKIKQIYVPEVKSRRKKELMYKSRNKFSDYFAKVAYNLKIYQNCQQKNPECLKDYDFIFLKEYNNLSLNLIITSLEVYIDYSIKDIIITRPLLIYLKYLENNNKGE